MTVILIVFISVTIGAALASFVMMNYKLRLFDNKIGRAEYEAEKSIDNIYMSIQESVLSTIDDAKNEAYTTILNDYNYDMEKFNNGVLNYMGTYIEIVNGKLIEKETIDTNLEVEYKKLCKDNMFKDIKNKLNDMEGIEIIDTPEFGKTAVKNEIKLEDNTDPAKEVIDIGLELYYKADSSPAIRFLVDFVISIPSYENANSGNYKLNEIINLTNWEMQDWGYL